MVAARILFQKPTGGVIEIFCLEPDDDSDITTAMAKTGSVKWKCLVGGASKWKHGQVLAKEIMQEGKKIILSANYIDKKAEHFIIGLHWTPADLSFAEILQVAGAIPLPPYMKRASQSSDRERYQTVYAEPEGSVAAPTAGLHFTPKIFESLKDKNIDTDFLTLHVGAGTFKPVKADRMEEHIMHSEWFDAKRETVEKLKNNLAHAIVAVGTTSLRAIESLYWLGCKITRSSVVAPISQWEPYEQDNNIAPADALQAVLDWMKNNNTERIISKTGIIIAPGYRPKIAKALITNFHQPGSTLLLLVAALIGDDWRKVYDHALKNEYRFLSYGDGSLLWFNV